MQSITLRELRDTRKVKAWLRAGVHIEVRERNEAIGDLVPRTTHPNTIKKPVQMPDFAARRRAIFGDRVLTPVADLIADRENSRY
jgi:antitoxin (DNA-binding transcriptional repressor) of toxin-antitoxin stability system